MNKQELLKFYGMNLEELILLEKNSATLIAGNLTNRNAA